MIEIAQLSGAVQFLFFVGCGYLALQLPFGWIVALLGLLLIKGVNLASTSAWGLPLNTPGTWVSYLVISLLLIGFVFSFLGKLPSWLIIVFFGVLLLLSLVGIVFSVYTLFKATTTFPLDIGIKIIAFLIGAALGVTNWIILHSVMVLSAIPSRYDPTAILIALVISIICAVVVMLGTYLMVTSPKVGYCVLGVAAALIVFIFFGFFAALSNSMWT